MRRASKYVASIALTVALFSPIGISNTATAAENSGSTSREAPVPPGNTGGPMIYMNDENSKARTDIFEFHPEKMSKEERDQNQQWARDAIILLMSYGTSAFPEESVGKYIHDGFGGYLFFTGPADYKVIVRDINVRDVPTREMQPSDKEYKKLIREFKNKYKHFYE